MGADGREYTPEQVQVVQSVLQAQKGGRGAHYRVLNISATATEGEIKVGVRDDVCVCCLVGCLWLVRRVRETLFQSVFWYTTADVVGWVSMEYGFPMLLTYSLP